MQKLGLRRSLHSVVLILRTEAIDWWIGDASCDQIVSAWMGEACTAGLMQEDEKCDGVLYAVPSPSELAPLVPLNGIKHLSVAKILIAQVPRKSSD